MALKIVTEITLRFQSRLARHISTLLGRVNLDVALLCLHFRSVEPSKSTARFNAQNPKLYLRRPLVKAAKVACRRLFSTPKAQENRTFNV
jgi:hypothetical protein